MHHQAHESINEIFPRARLAREAPFEEITVYFRKCHDVPTPSAGNLTGAHLNRHHFWKWHLPTGDPSPGAIDFLAEGAEIRLPAVFLVLWQPLMPLKTRQH